MRTAIAFIIVESLFLGFLIGCYYGMKQASNPVVKPQPQIIRNINV